MPGFPFHQQLADLTQTHVIASMMPSNHLVLCRPFLLLPSIFPSIRVFSKESVLCIRWSKYWSFSLSISPSNKHSRLISFRMDWLDLLAVQGPLKSLSQHHSSKASILWHSAFFIVQVSHLYMTTGKTIAVTRWTFVGKVMSLPFFFFNFYFYFILLYNTILVLPYIDLNQPRVYIHVQVPNPEPPSHLPPHIISLDLPRAPAPSILYPVLNIVW